jgi:hypothetical protein
MIHGSITWKYQHFRAFYDSGTLWDSGNPVRLRSSIGVAAGSDKAVGLILAFRVEGARLKPALMLTIK